MRSIFLRFSFYRPLKTSQKLDNSDAIDVLMLKELYLALTAKL